MSSSTERLTSWVALGADVQQCRADAQNLIGCQLATVRYLDIDYRQTDRPDGFVGPREVVDESQWAEPTWEFSICHSVDFGVLPELTTIGSFGVGW